MRLVVQGLDGRSGHLGSSLCGLFDELRHVFARLVLDGTSAGQSRENVMYLIVLCCCFALFFVFSLEIIRYVGSWLAEFWCAF